MSKTFMVIFALLISLPLLALVASVLYICFKISTTAGIVSLAIMLFCIAAAIVTFALIKRRNK